jgi:type VI secretion system secreted protein Hcp
MAFDAFIKLDGIPGESTDDKHKDWIEVQSFNWGVSQPKGGAVSTSGGGTSQRADFHEFTFTKALDKASPKLAQACAEGKHIKEIVMEICRAGGDKVKFYEIKMQECIITSYNPGGGAQATETLPGDHVGIDYGKITYTYTQQKRADGSGGGNVAGGWDRTTNKPIQL